MFENSFYNRLCAGVAFMLMPDWTGTGMIQRASANIEFLGAGGDRASVNLKDMDGTLTNGNVATIRSALSRLSNAVPIGTNTTLNSAVALGTDAPLDESYSSVDTKLVLTFQNELLATRQVAVPAPDEQFFGPDGVSAITPDALAGAGSAPLLMSQAVSSIINALELDGTTWNYTGGYRSSRGRSLPRPRVVVPSIEPGAGVFPDALPGEAAP